MSLLIKWSKEAELTATQNMDYIIENGALKYFSNFWMI